MARPTQLKPDRGCSPGCLAVFFALFLCVGVVFLYMMALRPLGQVLDAADWVQTPCIIESVRLSEGTGDDGDNHEIEVAYQYEAGGQTHRGDRYAFFMVASNVDGWMRREVAALATEPRTVCYVNPDHPAESVLRKGLTPSAWWALFPLPFVVIGAGGIIFALRQRGKSARPVSSTLTAGPSVAATPLSAPHDWLPKFRGPGEAMKLRSASTPGKRALVLLAVTLFWNGIVSIFVVQIIDEALDKGEIPWFPALFISLFVLVGLGIALGFIHAVMAMFNPRVTLTVAADAVALGGPLDVAWDMTGRTHRISRLEIWLEGVEKATYRQGTDTRTDTSRFARLPLTDTTDPAQIVAGAGSIMVPADTMHSLEAANNKIVWTLHVRGHIARWPDVNEEFPIAVLPREQAAGGPALIAEGEALS